MSPSRKNAAVPAETTDSEAEPDVEIIESLEDLEYLARWLTGVKRIGLDIEADSFYTYHPKVCLLQMSTDDYDFIIDPLTVRDMSPLGPILRDPAVEKVFHAAEYDLQCLKRDCGFQISNLFDTMTAARLLGMRQLGLAALIMKYFDVPLAKKFQRADWGKRPLSPEQIQYARMDTHFLLRLRDLLHKELEAKGRLSEAQDAFERLSRIEPPNKVFDADDFWRLPGARVLPAQSRSVLKELYYFREKTAAEMDKAPFRILSEALLVRLAEKSPSTLLELENMPGMTPYLLQRFGHGLVEVICKGLGSLPIEKQPARPRPPQDARSTQRCQALREWRKKKAEERGLDPAAILPVEDIHKVAHAASKSEAPEAWLADLTEHKRQLYGEELLEVLRAAGPTTKPSKRRRRKRR